MNRLTCIDSEIAYSGWHRSLGYSYFAMDIDYVEVRDDKPVALIEASLCTNKYPNCDGCDGVFNRFLKETGGFQFDLVYWVALWLNVPAFLICMKPLLKNTLDGKIHILSFSNGESACVDLEGYKEFIKNLPSVSYMFGSDKLELSLLLKKIKVKYPGIKVYPYFNTYKHKKWLEDYKQRISEIKQRKKREWSKQNRSAAQLPVKKETTGQRRPDYNTIRDLINLPYFNLTWVEWRKDHSGQTIGRPAAIIKTCAIKEVDDFESYADKGYQSFYSSRERIWWGNVADSLLVDWYFVSYHAKQNGTLSNEFIVWRNNEMNMIKINSLSEYANFIMHL